jgi:ribosome maturation factor RimP
MLTESLVEAFRVRVEALGYDLADLRIGGTAGRPLVQVRIDWPLSDTPRRVSVEDCSKASRALEAWLDAGGPLGDRYVLEVSSPGMDRPLRWPRHWVQFVGREVNAKIQGLGRVRARILSVPDAGTVVLELPGSEPKTVPLSQIRDAHLAVDW